MSFNIADDLLKDKNDPNFLPKQVGLSIPINVLLNGLIGYASQGYAPKSKNSKNKIIGGLLSGLPGGDLWASQYMYNNIKPGMINFTGRVLGKLPLVLEN